MNAKSPEISPLTVLSRKKAKLFSNISLEKMWHHSDINGFHVVLDRLQTAMMTKQNNTTAHNYTAVFYKQHTIKYTYEIGI